MALDWSLLDTWPAWQSVWARVADAPMEAQIDAWATEYMARYPALFDKQVTDYVSAGMDWRDVAWERVFPFMAARTPRMAIAHDVILQCHDAVATRSGERLRADFAFRFVVYVGLECGAGWATTYEGSPACLLGLEAIANRNWHTEDRLTGLLAHELGHLAHMVWRERAGVSDLEESEANPLFQLYSEGFAQRAEHVTLDRDTWHMCDEHNAWLTWCQAHAAWLAEEFLQRVDAGEEVYDFFGSWFAIEGHSQTGYYLGYQVVRAFENEGLALQEIAAWPEEKAHRQVRRVLRGMASEGER